MGTVGRCASHAVTVSLIKAKCLPMMLYETEACHFSVREATSLEHQITCALFKLFHTKSSEILDNCKLTFGLQPFYLLLLRQDISTIISLQLLITLSVYLHNLLLVERLCG